MEKAGIKRVIKLLLLLAMVSFFFPFALVSCSGESVEASGFELMTTISFNEEKEFDEDDTPNYYLAAAFIFGIVGLACAWKTTEKNKMMIAAGGCGAGGAICLLLFRSTFWEFYEITGYDGQVTVEFRWGWIISLIAYIGATAASFFYQYICSGEYQKDKPASSSQTFDALLAVEKVSEQKGVPCPYCGQYALFKENSCEYCGFSFASASNDDNHSCPTDLAPQKNAPAEDAERKIPIAPRVIIRYSSNGQELCIEVEKYPCMIGRDSSSCTIGIQDSKASRIHAQLTRHDTAILIEDMGSSNGTHLNGNLISNPTELLSGDAVVIGTTQLSFEISSHSL